MFREIYSWVLSLCSCKRAIPFDDEVGHSVQFGPDEDERQKSKANKEYVMAIQFKILNRDDEAIEKFLAAIKIEPTFFMAYFELAHIFHKLKRPQEALEYYEKAIALDGNNEQCHFKVGILKMESGDIKAAMYHFDKSARIFRQAVKQEETYFTEFLKANPQVIKDLAQLAKSQDAAKNGGDIPPKLQVIERTKVKKITSVKPLLRNEVMYDQIVP